MMLKRIYIPPVIETDDLEPIMQVTGSARDQEADGEWGDLSTKSGGFFLDGESDGAGSVTEYDYSIGN